MPAKKTPVYDNASITSLKGADRVRKRPAVIFGSDGIEGCEHSVFEILSNSVDEAREGYGDKIYITVTRDSRAVTFVERYLLLWFNAAMLCIAVFLLKQKIYMEDFMSNSKKIILCLFAP